ncbi:MAG: class I SAM-dependent methyltransferase [Planctomycetota bacterium]
MSSLKADIRDYWDEHPIGVEAIGEDVGSREFYEKYVAYYDQFYRYKWRVFQYEQYRGKKVLEVGCGLGIDSYKFAKAGADLTCIDLSRTSVANTRRLLEHLDLRAEVLQGDAENVPVPDESFDAVYSYGVLMLVENEQKAYDEVLRVLKPGGEALVTLYHRRSWFWMLKKISGTKVESEAGDPPINRVHTLREVRHLFRRFSQVEIILERFPERTRRRKGTIAFLFNWIFVPLMKIIPRPLIRPFGWHIVVKAVK